MRDLTAVDFCPGCGRVLEAACLPRAFFCGGCRTHPPAFDGLLAAFAYAPPFDSVIRGLKFRRLEYLGEALAGELFRRFEGALGAHDLVVAVPLHWRRRLSRGFNQAEAIARPLAIHAGIATARALRRSRATVSQAGLPREERLRNPRRAFFAAADSVREARVLLVDDVVTTGATVNAAAIALKEAGAASVTVLAAARTLEEAGGRGGSDRR
jgi:ComF family protein